MTAAYEVGPHPLRWPEGLENSCHQAGCVKRSRKVWQPEFSLPLLKLILLDTWDGLILMLVLVTGDNRKARYTDGSPNVPYPTICPLLLISYAHSSSHPESEGINSFRSTILCFVKKAVPRIDRDHNTFRFQNHRKSLYRLQQAMIPIHSSLIIDSQGNTIYTGKRSKIRNEVLA